VQLIMEGVAVQGSVSYGEYAYYEYLDSQPNLDLEIDLQPTSGDADLYVGCLSNPTGTDAGFPSRLHYNMSSNRYMEDSLWIRHTDVHHCSRQGGIFYIAVLGYSFYQTVSFDLRVTHYGGTKILAIGKPVTDSVFKTFSALYKFRMGFETMAATISLQTLTGDADLYVLMGNPATAVQFDYYSTKLGTLPDIITIPENRMCSDCWVSVLVYGYQTSTFTLLVTLSNTVVQLVDSAPMVGAVAADDFQIYTSSAPYSGTATAVLTVFSGSPDLFISLINDEPIAQGADTFGDDSESTGNLPVVSISNVIAGQTIYVGVTGAGTNSTYSVRISVDPRTVDATARPPIYTLISGQPQSDTIGVNTGNDYSGAVRNLDWKYYILPVPAGHESLTVRGTRIIGEADFYVLKCPFQSAADCRNFLPSATRYNMTTAELSDDIMTISRQDDSPCSYVVGVHSMSYFTAYQISESLEHSVLALQGGITVTDHANLGETDYYSFYLDDELSVKFMLTKVSGDPDIYVTTNSTHLPSPTNAKWKSINWGSDVLSIDPRTDTTACSQCTYYIAIVGEAESTYRLTATTAYNVPVLTDGMPVNDHVGPLSWNYYTFYDTYGALRDLKITLTTTVGDADIFVTLDGSKPSWDRFDYYSMNFFSNDEVRISHTDDAYAPCLRTDTNAGCQIRIAISGLALSSEYSLVLTSSLSASLLALGVPLMGTVQEDSYEYYRVVANSGSNDVADRYQLSFSLTVFSGSVNAYISCGSSNWLPNMTSHAWRIEAPDQLLSIGSVDMMEHGCTTADEDAIGASLFVSLFGLQSSSYTLTASMDLDSSMITLVPGIIQQSSVDYRSFRYFLIRPGSSYQNVRLVLTVQQGDAYMYASGTWSDRPVYSASQEAVIKYQLSSHGTAMVLTHQWFQSTCKKNHPVNQCYIVVGVYGAFNANSPTNFNIGALNEDSTLLLINGVPQRGIVDSRDYAYYRYILTQPNVDVTFSLTPFNGDADLFVAMAPILHPSSSNFSWLSTAYGDDTLTIQSTEYSHTCVPNPATAKHCDFYIGVYGFINTSYTLTASMDTGFENPVALLDGQPQAGHVAAGKYTYYRYKVAVANTSIPSSITFTLTVKFDSSFRNYIFISICIFCSPRMAMMWTCISR
jgi:hypothetical protein